MGQAAAERVHQFFDEQLPLLIEHQRDLFAKSKGSLGVIV